jgi:hypothetical protein
VTDPSQSKSCCSVSNSRGARRGGDKFACADTGYFLSRCASIFLTLSALIRISNIVNRVCVTSNYSKVIEILAPTSFERTKVQFWCSHKRFTIDKPNPYPVLWLPFTAGSVILSEILGSIPGPVSQ